VQTQVVVLGTHPPEPAGPGPAVSEPAGPEGVLLHPVDDPGALPARLRPGVHVLVLAERRHAALLGRACAMVAAGAEVPVLGRALPHGPLALRLLADLAAALDAPPSYVVAALDDTAEGTFSGAWLPTVAHLADPSPSVLQHARSWMPGRGGFLVEHAPRVRVRALDGGAHGEDTTGADAVPRAALVVAGSGVPDPVLRVVQRLAAARERVAAPASPDAEARYGTPDAVGLAALPERTPVLPARDRVPACRVCGLPVVQDACPYCRASVAPLAAAAGA